MWEAWQFCTIFFVLLMNTGRVCSVATVPAAELLPSVGEFIKTFQTYTVANSHIFIVMFALALCTREQSTMTTFASFSLFIPYLTTTELQMTEQKGTMFSLSRKNCVGGGPGQYCPGAPSYHPHSPRPARRGVHMWSVGAAGPVQQREQTC